MWTLMLVIERFAARGWVLRLAQRFSWHAFGVYAKLLRTIPKHLSQVAGTQCIDRHWRSLKEFIGKAFPRKLKGNLGSKLHPKIDTLIKQWLYRIWAPSASPIEVYQNLTHVLPSLW